MVELICQGLILRRIPNGSSSVLAIANLRLLLILLCYLGVEQLPSQISLGKRISARNLTLEYLKDQWPRLWAAEAIFAQSVSSATNQALDCLAKLHNNYKIKSFFK